MTQKDRNPDPGTAVHRGIPTLTTTSRRDFLRYSAVAGAGLLGSGVLAACTSSSAPTSTSASASTSVKPKAGGTIHFATTGGAPFDGLDPHRLITNPDIARSLQLFDGLMEMDPNGLPTLALAEEVTPNSDATAWTIRIRKGVEFHNGKPLTIDDVIFTFNRILGLHGPGALALSVVNMKDAKKIDQYTVVLPMNLPYSVLPQLVYNTGHGIVPVGFDPKKPIGTGPFKYQSFTPGQQSVFPKNDNYWRSGEPYVDSLIITEYADETSQVNALLSGQADCIDQLTQASVAALNSGGKKVLISNGAGSVPFTIRLDAPPFSDVRVRQALRLVVDRPQMRESVQGGYGLLGNDIFAIIDPEYDHSFPQRQQDIAQAKYLLKQAGKESMTITLVTAPIRAGAIESATVFKQQAAQAGITVNLDTITSGAFFAKILTWDFSQDFWSYSPYITQATYDQIRGAAFDETHWGTSQYSPQYMSLYRQALAATNTATQTSIVHEMMKMDYDEGGYILPFFSANIVAFSPSLNGITAGLTGQPFVEWRFRDMWFS